MNTDYKNIIDIYNNSSDIEKLIFVDVINDLIKWIPKHRKAKKIPQSLYIEDMAKDFEKQMNFQSVKEYIKFMNEIKDFIYEWIDIKDRKSGMFNIKKWTTLIPKNIKEYYHYIWEDEIDSIHQYRKLFLKNLEYYWFIEIYVYKNEEYHKICEDFLNSITELDNKNRRVYIWLNNIKDDFARRSLERIQTDYWVNSIKKQIEYIFNDLEVENYLCKEEDIIKLYEKITWEKIHKDYIEYNFVNEYIILSYKWKELEFEKWYMPYQILEMVLPSKKNEGVQLADLFKHINNIDFYYRDHKNELPKIRSTISWINRRFAKIYWKNEKLLSFKNQALIRVK